MITTEQQKKSKEYYLANRDKILNRVKAYYLTKGLTTRRQSALYSKGKRYTGLKKRLHTGYCEICGKVMKKHLVYHHWDKENLSMGMWLCNPCHWFVEGIERGLQLRKYLDLKIEISKQYVKVGNVVCKRWNSD